MKILVTGGAGYIGSNCVKILSKTQDVVVVDDFSTGHYDAIEGQKYYKANIKDNEAMDKIFKTEKPDCVIHFAAKSLVAESVKNPYKYFDNNVTGTLELLKVMVANNCLKIVFSSSAAVYGNVNKEIITEDTPLNPECPYGETKAMMEHIMKWFDKAYGLKYVALRYFNVSGASEDGTVGEDHNPETHLIPLTIKTMLKKRDKLSVFGSDYNTKDGTCVRDYINMIDLVDAHIKAVDYLMKGNDSNVFNLGTEEGSSNLEIIKAVEKVSGRKVNYEMADRRAGDPDSLIASSKKAKEALGFENKHNLEDSIKTAIIFSETHPEGYKK